jgi:hypothetical protein
LLLLALANDFPSVWRHPSTSMAMKKRIVRTLIEEIMTDVDDATSMMECVIRWAGGCHTSLGVRKQRTGQHRFTCTIKRRTNIGLMPNACAASCI